MVGQLCSAQVEKSDKHEHWKGFRRGSGTQGGSPGACTRAPVKASCEL
jgi:hypothetical protein